LGGGGWAGMHFDHRQAEEILLTGTQSVFALVVLVNFRFTLLESAILAALFMTQLAMTDERARTIFAFVYLLLAAIWALASADSRRGMMDVARFVISPRR